MSVPGDGASEEDRLASLIDIREGTEGGVVGPGWDGHGRSVAGHSPAGYLQDSRFHRSDLRGSVVDVVAVEAGVESGCGLRLELEETGGGIVRR